MIPFLKYKFLYLAISTVVILTGLFSIVMYGYRMSIDFTGGTTLKYQVSDSIKDEALKAEVKKSGKNIIEYIRTKNDVTIRVQALEDKEIASVTKYVTKESKLKSPLLKSETVSPSLSSETVTKTLTAAVLAIFAILFYIAYAFKNFQFAIGVVVALVHDLIVLLGMYSIVNYFFPAEFDTLFVTALLTTMAFSVHDTIIMFDQLRYYMKRQGTENIEEHANKAITETFVRSYNNSVTTIFMLIALVLLAGESIRYFAVALLIGTITGTYSSPFVSLPITVWLIQRKNKFLGKKK